MAFDEGIRFIKACFTMNQHDKLFVVAHIDTAMSTCMCVSGSCDEESIVHLKYVPQRRGGGAG